MTEELTPAQLDIRRAAWEEEQAKREEEKAKLKAIVGSWITTKWELSRQFEAFLEEFNKWREASSLPPILRPAPNSQASSRYPKQEVGHPIDWTLQLGKTTLHIFLDPTFQEEEAEFFGEITVLGDPDMAGLRSGKVWSDEEYHAELAKRQGLQYYRWVVVGDREGKLFEIDSALQPCDYPAVVEMVEKGFVPKETSFRAMLEKTMADLVELEEGKGYLDRKPPAFECELRLKEKRQEVCEQPLTEVFEKLGVASLDELKEMDPETRERARYRARFCREEIGGLIVKVLKGESAREARQRFGIQLGKMADKEVIDLYEMMEDEFSIDKKKSRWLVERLLQKQAKERS